MSTAQYPLLPYAPARIRACNDFIWVSWDEAPDAFKAGKINLIRPDTHKGQHYTGKVMAVGPDADPEIKVGTRLLFDQFSNFEKYRHPDIGRIAVLKESEQASAFAVVPERLKISSAEGDFNYDL